MSKELDKDLEYYQRWIKEIKESNANYYLTGHSLMTDATYDTLVEELKKIEERLKAKMGEEKFINSPLNKIGFDITDAPVRQIKKPLTNKMFSLKKDYNFKAVIDWAIKLKNKYSKSLFSLQPKLDGLAIEVNYVNGKLSTVMTRGDGTIGIDVTHNAKFIEGIPLSVGNKTFSAYGEVIVPLAHFKNLGLENNPRNLVSGALMSLDHNKIENKKLIFIMYDVIGLENHSFTLHKDLLDYIKEISEKSFINIYDFSTLVTQIDVNKDIDYDKLLAGVKTKYESFIKFFPCDGLVLKTSDLELKNKLYDPDKKYPSHSIAYKFNNPNAITTFKHVEWIVDKKGKLNPTGVFEEVVIEGSKINKASLSNINIIKKLGIYEGAKIIVEKAGMIIPKISIVLSTEDKVLKFPDRCISCGSPLEEKEEDLYCTDIQNCKGALLAQCKYVYGKSVFNISSLGEAVIKKLIEAKLIKTWLDLFDLTLQDFEKILSPKMAKMVFCNLNKGDYSNIKIILSFDIETVGGSKAKEISKAYSDLQDFLNTNRLELKSRTNFTEAQCKKIIANMLKKDLFNQKILEKIDEYRRRNQ